MIFDARNDEIIPIYGIRKKEAACTAFYLWRWRGNTQIKAEKGIKRTKSHRPRQMPKDEHRNVNVVWYDVHPNEWIIAMNNGTARVQRQNQRILNTLSGGHVTKTRSFPPIDNLFVCSRGNTI